MGERDKDTFHYVWVPATAPPTTLPCSALRYDTTLPARLPASNVGRGMLWVTGFADVVGHDTHANTCSLPLTFPLSVHGDISLLPHSQTSDHSRL
jgi:hypothetical protein